jgi:hypothetical protein
MYSISRSYSIKHTVPKFFRKSLFNVQYDLKIFHYYMKNRMFDFFQITSIKCTVRSKKSRPEHLNDSIL